MIDQLNNFANDVLDTEQIERLKAALAHQRTVHLYGFGLGKSLLADILRRGGYSVTEPGDYPCGSPNMMPDEPADLLLDMYKRPHGTYGLAEITGEVVREWVNSSACED